MTFKISKHQSRTLLFYLELESAFLLSPGQTDLSLFVIFCLSCVLLICTDSNLLRLFFPTIDLFTTLEHFCSFSNKYQDEPCIYHPELNAFTLIFKNKRYFFYLSTQVTYSEVGMLVFTFYNIYLFFCSFKTILYLFFSLFF